MMIEHKMFLGAVLADLPPRVVGAVAQIVEPSRDITGRGLTGGMRI